MRRVGRPFLKGAIMVALLKNPSHLKINPGTERRMFKRMDCHVSLEARRLDFSLAARRDPRVALEMRDISISGCGARTETPMLRGERVSLYFPPQGENPAWDAIGR